MVQIKLRRRIETRFWRINVFGIIEETFFYYFVFISTSFYSSLCPKVVGHIHTLATLYTACIALLILSFLYKPISFFDTARCAERRTLYIWMMMNLIVDSIEQVWNMSNCTLMLSTEDENVQRNSCQLWELACKVSKEQPYRTDHCRQLKRVTFLLYHFQGAAVALWKMPVHAVPVRDTHLKNSLFRWNTPIDVHWSVSFCIIRVLYYMSRYVWR